MTQLIILTENQIQLAKEKAELLDLLIQSVEEKCNQAKSDSEGMDEIISALEEYGKTTFELQNMESEFRWWQEVKKEIELL